MKFNIKEIFKFRYIQNNVLDIVNSLNLSVVLVNLLSPVFITYLLYSKVNTVFLHSILFCQLCIVLLRFYNGKVLKRSIAKGNKSEILTNIKIYLSIIFITGLLWGVLFSYSILFVEQTYIFFILTLVFALSSGSILTLGSVFLAVFLFNTPIIIPTVISLLYTELNLLYVFQTIVLLMFLYVTLKTAYKKEYLFLQSDVNLDLIKQYERITNMSGIISKTDLKGRITHVNDNFCNISGYSREELVGQPHNIVRHPDVPSSTYESMWHTIKEEKKAWHGIIKNKAKNGEPYYLNATVSPILDSEGNIKEFISLRYDISSIMSDKNQLFDYLEANKLSVLIMIQIEDYNTLEKFYDKATVEEIEKKFGDAILYLFPNDCNFQRVYHLGNGLYALAKDRRTCQHSQQEIEAGLREFLHNVKSYMVKLDKIEYDISAICSYTYGVIQIYEDAKIGIEKAIENKLDIVYADGLSGIEYAIALNNIETLHTIKVALDGEKVVSFFQPIVNNRTCKVEKYESLVRLINEFGQVISPYAFLDIAKKGRYYTQITNIVLENSFKILKETDKEVSINLSVIDIETASIRKKIFELLDAQKEDAKRVVFELLESEDIKDFDTVIRFIKSVKPLGVKIAIDDFGTGYSNFQRLLQYEPDILKIDGSLIKDIQENKLSKDIVETIVTFAQKQKLKTIAEFVENEDIFNIVKEIGIDYSQGYAFGKPEEYINDEND